MESELEQDWLVVDLDHLGSGNFDKHLPGDQLAHMIHTDDTVSELGDAYYICRIVVPFPCIASWQVVLPFG